MLVAFLNYVFHPILGRLLSPADFGDVQVLISLIAQSAVIFGVFSIMAVNITTNVENQNERDAIITELRKIAFWIVGFISIFILISMFWLKSFFNFSSVYPIVGLVVILLISPVTIFRSAFLQGSGRFRELSSSGVISSFGRIIFSVIFVLLGLNVFGVTLGIILANISLLIYLYYKTSSSLNLGVKSGLYVLEEGSIVRELKYGLLVFFATGLIVIFYTSDILIVKHYFNSVEAGLYSGISAIAKILFFVIGPASAVLLSSVKVENSFKENNSCLKKSLIVSFIIGVVGLLTFYLFNDIIVKLMIGKEYASLAYLLPKVGLVMFLTAVIEVFTFYFLALRRFFLVAVSLVGISFMVLTLFNSYVSIAVILDNLLKFLVVILILLTSVYAKDYFSYNTRS